MFDVRRSMFDVPLSLIHGTPVLSHLIPAKKLKIPQSAPSHSVFHPSSVQCFSLSVFQLLPTQPPDLQCIPIHPTFKIHHSKSTPPLLLFFFSDSLIFLALPPLPLFPVPETYECEKEMCPAFSPPLPPSSTSLDTESLKPIPKNKKETLS
jgi:hypothetical protein